jgi:hypothetical protein
MPKIFAFQGRIVAIEITDYLEPLFCPLNLAPPQYLSRCGYFHLRAQSSHHQHSGHDQEKKTEELKRITRGSVDVHCKHMADCTQTVLACCRQNVQATTVLSRCTAWCDRYVAYTDNHVAEPRNGFLAPQPVAKRGVAFNSVLVWPIAPAVRLYFDLAS